MTVVSFYVDPSCPWAWITARWLKEVAPHRDLEIAWRSYCLEIRDDYDIAPWVDPGHRDRVIAAHALSHRMLRIFEAARAEHGEETVDRLYEAWGRRYFYRDHPEHADGSNASGDNLLSACVEACGLDPGLVEAQHDEKWDMPILESMEVAYAFGGPKTQTPTIVIESDPPHGFKGPVMAPAPTGDDALRLWDAIVVVSSEPGFFELTRPRAARPVPPPL